MSSYTYLKTNIMKLIKFTLSICVLSCAIAFSYSNTQLKEGEFGVCGISKEKAQVYLVLNNDGSFFYLDKGNANHAFETEGTWEQIGNKVMLNPCIELKGFRNEWKLEKGNQAIKSRYGLSFYRLGNLGACKCDE